MTHAHTHTPLIEVAVAAGVHLCSLPPLQYDTHTHAQPDDKHNDCSSHSTMCAPHPRLPSSSCKLRRPGADINGAAPLTFFLFFYFFPAALLGALRLLRHVRVRTVQFGGLEFVVRVWGGRVLRVCDVKVRDAVWGGRVRDGGGGAPGLQACLLRVCRIAYFKLLVLQRLSRTCGVPHIGACHLLLVAFCLLLIP